MPDVFRHFLWQTFSNAHKQQNFTFQNKPLAGVL